MIKYELRRSKKSDGWMIMVGYDFKTVGKKELKRHVDEGWEILRKRYFIITLVKDWWNGLSHGNRISVFGIFLSTALALFFGFQNIYLSRDNKILTQKVDSLKSVTRKIDSLSLSNRNLIDLNKKLTDSIEKQKEYYKEQSLSKPNNADGHTSSKTD